MRRSVVVDKEAMAMGYVEMAELNLAIAADFFAAEEQGWRVAHEVDTTEAGGNA